MNIIFMGSAAFAIPSLNALAEAGHKIIQVVTQPDKPAGRGMKMHVCPLALAAKQLSLPLYQPKSVKISDSIEYFRKLSPDIIVIVAYGKILPEELLKIPPRGCVNVHASLLPKYRGAAPINWAIANGEKQTGVTTMLINKELDAGDILLAAKTNIDEAETANLLHDRLAIIGADLLVRTIEVMEKGEIKPIPQDHSKATYAPIIKKEDGHVDWTMSSSEIYDRIRAFNPWPGVFAKLDGKILKICEAASFEKDVSEKPGTIIENEKQLAVACGSGILYLLELQPEGKRKMSSIDFVHGHKIEKGTLLE